MTNRHAGVSNQSGDSSGEVESYDAQPGGTKPSRIIDRIDGADRAGPVLICVGGLHGNEPGGVRALERVCKTLRESSIELGGTLLAMRGNCSALQVGQRALERDLNRVWTPEQVERLRSQDPVLDDITDGEQRALLQELETLLASGRKVILLDLHSTSGGGPPFVVVLGQKLCERLASKLGAPCVHGLNESIHGTLTSWFSEGYGAALVVEGGRSGAPSTVAHLEAAVYSGLAVCGLLPDDNDRVIHGRQRLAHETDGLPRHVRVFYREGVRDMEFAMGSLAERRFMSFDAVRHRDPLATNKNGPIVAPQNGYLIMPLYQDQGGEGFFLAEPCTDPSG